MARLGVDEFVLLFPGIGGEALAAHERRLHTLVEQPLQFADVVVQIEANVGATSASRATTRRRHGSG